MVFFGQGVGLGEGGEGVGEGTGIMVKGQPAKINNRSISETLLQKPLYPEGHTSRALPVKATETNAAHTNKFNHFSLIIAKSD